MLPGKRCLAHGMCLYQVMMMLHFLNDVVNDAESIQKLKGGSHMRPRMDFHLVLHGEYLWPINYKNAFIYFHSDL